MEFNEVAARDRAAKGDFISHDIALKSASDPRMTFDRMIFVEGARWQHSQMLAQYEAAVGIHADNVKSVRAERDDAYLKYGKLLRECQALLGHSYYFNSKKIVKLKELIDHTLNPDPVICGSEQGVILK